MKFAACRIHCDYLVIGAFEQFEWKATKHDSCVIAVLVETADVTIGQDGQAGVLRIGRAIAESISFPLLGGLLNADDSSDDVVHDIPGNIREA